MKILEDSWLASIFGYPVFKVDVPANNLPDHNPLEPLAHLSGHIADQPQALYYAKIGTAEIDTVRKLSALGFYVVDVNVTFGLEVKPGLDLPKPTQPQRCSIEEASPGHYDKILDIAASSFRYSRFHLDPLIPKNIADEIKREWIISYIKKARGDKLFAALEGNKPVGFLAALVGKSDGEDAGTIDLVAVKSSHQGRSIGRALTTFFINYYRDKYDRLTVGTQVVNIPSMRLYEKLGFSITASQYVIHMHAVRGRPRT